MSLRILPTAKLTLISLLGVSLCSPGLAQSPLQTTPFPSSPLPPVQPGLAPAQNVPSPAVERAIAAPPSPTSYTLGAGDLVRVEIFETPELVLEPRYTVLIDGTLNLPLIGPVPVQGLTLAQASETISLRYSRFIRRPVITVGLAAPRPLKIGVVGEVNRPGSYIIPVISNESIQTNLTQRSAVSESGSQWPTVSRALQAAGGITQLANVRQVQIRRLGSAGSEEVITVDLWRFLQEGDLSQDAILRDGDTIQVAKATQFDPEELTQIGTSNFSPEVIRVNVVGEVVTPGAVAVRPNTTLNQAILAAGGLRNERASRQRVELIRLNPDGSVTRRELNLDFSKGLNEENNPSLRNNDVVLVQRTGLARTSDFLSVLLAPFNAVFGVVNLLRN